MSRGGEHKVVALWRYDKRDYYGSPVVYHGMQLLNVESDPPLLSAMVAYVTSVLDALILREPLILARALTLTPTLTLTLNPTLSRPASVSPWRRP